jgi:hypothetical protein
MWLGHSTDRTPLKIACRLSGAANVKNRQKPSS